MVFDENRLVRIADCPGEYPPYYIASRSGGKSAEKYICYDAMMYAENLFEYDWKADGAAKDERSRKYITSSQFMTIAAEQMGVPGIGGGGSDIRIPKKYLRGKTIKDGLLFLANAWGGSWYVNSSGAVQFAPYGQYFAVFDASGVPHSAVNVGFERDAVSRVIMTNTEKNKVFDTLGSGNFTAIVNISSPAADSDLANGILERADGFVYKAFNCSDILANQNIEVGSRVIFSDEDSFTAFSVTLSLTAHGVYASVSAPEITESEYEFRGSLDRRIDGCIALGRQYDGMIYDDGALSFDFSEE